ncbi:MAG: molecular chaperone DnaK [Deltaproteobacteria bacterium]|nr:molecular chaperone DnaK [Deltaproteobacteria bacterium]
MSKAIGIDLGTTFSVAACLEFGRPAVIPDIDGNRLTPSVVAILEDGKRVVGKRARLQAEENPDGTVFSIKRRMGRNAYIGPDCEVTEKGLITQVKRHMGSDFRVMIRGKEYTPEEISAVILRKLKRDAGNYLGEEISKAVVSVPAYFNISQRQATLDAGAIAGLDVIRIIDEPTAAALAYGLDIEGAETVMVWDLGGGTFDVSILELGGGVFEVKSVSGNTWLGGEDYDQRIVEYLLGEFKKGYGADIGTDKSAMIRLKETAERAKIELTDRDIVQISFFFNKRRLETVLTRTKFEELTGDLAESMIAPTERALKDAGLRPEEIDRIILVGGSTRMPRVRKLFGEIMGREPYIDIHPDEVVSMGAAIQAGILTGEIDKKILIDVTPIALGIETEGGLFTKIMERNTTVPATRSRLFTNSAEDQTSMEIHVLQGERAMAAYNITMDRFDLSGIEPQRRGEAMVEIKFEIDANGILRVSATDLRTESSNSLRISPRFYGLAKNEIGRMIKEAGDCIETDLMESEEALLFIKANNMIASSSLLAEEARSLLSVSEYVIVETMECEAQRLRDAVSGADTRSINDLSGKLEDAIKAVDRVLKNRRHEKVITAGKPGRGLYDTIDTAQDNA